MLSLVIMRSNLLQDPSDNRTIAHELGHLQACCVLGKRIDAIPKYFFEGHDLMMDQLYAGHLGVAGQSFSASIAKAVMSLSPQEAREILDGYSNPGKDPRRMATMERLGLYFVEYTRTRLQGRCIPGMARQLGRVFEGIGEGGTCEQAYRVPASQVVEEIAGLFERTQAQPAKRLEGTRFEYAVE